LEALRIADTQFAPFEERDDLLQLYEAMIDDLEKEEDEEAHIEMCKHINNLLIRQDWRRVLKDHRSKAKRDHDLLPVVDELVESRRSKVVSAHREVKTLYNNGYFGAAMEKAFLALRDAPTFLPLHITIGDLLLEQGRQSAAIKKYLAVADVYKVQDKLERALALYKNIIELAPLNIDVRQEYIDLLEEYGQRDQAVHEYINLADVYYSLAELQRARETYEKALELISVFSLEKDWERDILHRMADIDAQRLDWDSALEVYKRIRDSHPSDKEASKKIIELHYRLGDDRKANHEMERYIGLLDPENEPSRIIQYLEELKEENPKKAGIRKTIASFYQAQGQEQQAVAELDSAGDMLLDEGDRVGAIQIIEEIISLNPANVEDYQKLLSQLKR
jgi:tetratricopeptide (TPR) repeat protein